MLGPATAHRLDVQVGDRLPFGDKGEHVRVTGIGLLPQSTASAYDEGAWVTPLGLRRLVGDGYGQALLVHFRNDGAGIPIDPLPSAQGTLENELEHEAQVVGNFRRIGRLPWIELAFFAALGVGSIAHLLTSSWRLRRRDLAMLRCLGMTPRQIRAIVGWQGLTFALAGLVLGVPLGLVAGTTLWRTIAHDTPLVYRTPLAGWTLAVLAPTTLVAVALLAIQPARRAGRLAPAEELGAGRS
ncbi:MAG: FtsX-like permease family protein [Acidimicrobiia bacterium]|nr:FtsX-like permease family protein [Acidimicrobiia bacterium]